MRLMLLHVGQNVAPFHRVMGACREAEGADAARVDQIQLSLHRRRLALITQPSIASDERSHHLCATIARNNEHQRGVQCGGPYCRRGINAAHTQACVTARG